MTNHKRIILFAFALTLLLIAGCVSTAGEVRQQELTAVTSFKDIPGVTEAEIVAIEGLQSRFGHFVYGMPPSTEAFLDENGRHNGFSALFCEWLSELFGIEFRVELLEWSELFEGLGTGEIQFSGELTPTPARLEIFDMTAPIAMRPVKSYRIADSEPLSEIIAVRPQRCGFIVGAATINAVTSQMAPGTFEVIELDDFTDVYDALKSGEIDAFYYSGVAEFIFVEHEDMVFTEFFPLIFMPVSLTTQTPELAPFISVMEKALESNDIRRFISDMYSRGYQQYLQYKLFIRLTDDERGFISQSTVIPVAVENDNYPLSFYNERDDEWQGIAVDVLREVEALTALRFKRVNDKDASFADLLSLMAQGEAVMITDLMFTDLRNARYLWPDTSLLAARSSLIAKSDQRDVTLNEILHMRIGVIKDYAHTDYFRNWFPDHQGVYEYDSTLSAFDALDKGEIDAVMAGDSSLLILTHYLERPGYKIIYLFDNPFNSTFGINGDEVLLHSIMSKALRQISTEMISEQWVRKTFDYQSKVVEAQIPWVISAFAALVFIILGISIAFVKGLKLTRQRVEAEIANRTKTAFLANMSHEIRTPMNSIVGFTELALDDDISPKTKNYLRNILTNSEGLLHIINDILDISKIESGNLELESIPFDPRDLLSACRNMVTPKANEKGLKLDFSADPPVGRVPLGDPTRLRQIFVNLLSNAVKFTDSGTVSFQATIKGMTENTLTVYVEIKDTGIGMTEEQIKEIFLPFKQAESETTRKYGGTGLGLAITKNLLDAMGGELKVESTPGGGSTFSFELTFDTIEQTADDALKNKSVQRKLKKPTFEGEILLFEDNVMNQQVICEHLTRVGLKTVVAENGRIGVELMRERLEKIKNGTPGIKQFDLIFMDMHMPEMDGHEAAKLINEMDTGVPIVAMTANIMTGDREQYEMHGMSGYLGKPFTSQELWHCLINYFEAVNWQLEDESEQDKITANLRPKLISRFLKSNKEKYVEIMDAIGTGDITLAHRLVHTLKSNAGQLGKTELQQAADEVEDSLKDGKNLVTALQMQSLTKELDAVIEEFTAIETESEPPAVESTESTAGLDVTAALELFDELEPILKESNFDCLTFTERLQLVPGSGELIGQIESFEFASALKSLTELREKLGRK